MGLCNVTGRTKQENMERMSKVWNYWLDKKNITNRFGGSKNYDRIASADNMKWLIEQRLELPWESDSYLDDASYRRIRVEIDAFDNALGGKFSNLAWVVPEGISKQDPTSRKFYLQLNEILNYERVNINKVLTDNGVIANYMLDAYEMVHGKGKGDKALKKLRDLRKEMAEADPSEHVQAEFVAKIEEFVMKDKEGETLKEFIDLIHMSHDDFNAAKNPDFVDTAEFMMDGTTKNPFFNQKRDFNPHVYQAVIRAKQNLQDMSKVYSNSLVGLQKIIALKYTNNADINLARNIDKKAGRMIDIIQDSITDIEKGNEDGGYFPEVQFDTILQIKDRLSKAMNATTMNRDYAFSDVVDNVLSGIDINSLPAHAQRKSNVIEQYWEKDPLMVLKEYGDQAAQFNKMVHTQISYLDALKHLPKTDIEFQKGLKRFIDEEYTVFTHGVSGRPDWANGAVSVLNSLQTARTMGLNITGAVKNAASAIHFYSRVGMGALNATRAAMKDATKPFAKMMEAAEQEAGFLFTDVAKELYTEGLITRDQQKEIQFDPISGKITMKNQNFKNALIDAGKWTLDKALFFHRLTENSQRKWMFRTAMHMKYTQLVDSGYDAVKSKQFAQAHALKMVNGWAYEYAAHAKSKLVRGEGRVIEEFTDGSVISREMKGGAGAMSEIAFHLLHYPMSLFETHYDALKGVHKSLLAKQGVRDSEELQYAMRYAGASLIIAIGSALTNIDFTNIIENESVERMQRVVDDLTQYESKEKGTFGLLSEFSGPTIGTLKHIAVAQEIIDIEHSDLNKILFGNVDFADDNDKLATMYAAYQWSTEWGVIKNKLWPSLKAGRGRDLITHWLKLYPNTLTKETNKLIYQDILGVRKPKKKKRKGPTTNYEKALVALERMR
tara:strand:- start:257 stop:2935 length:2679 start_codon:yes stop_codon:yes gene_type:complete